MDYLLHVAPVLEIGFEQWDLSPQTESLTQRSRFPVFNPPLQVWESGEAYTVHLLVPGADREKLNVEATPQQVSVSGEIKLSSPANAELRYQEVESQPFHRSLKFSRRIQPEKVSATYTDGVLSLTLPKVEAARVVKVQVSTPEETLESKTVSVESQAV